MNRPLVSVIMPTFNTREDFLKASIGSILHQTYTNIELVIIDDCSETYSDTLYCNPDPRIRVIRNPQNLGVAGSLNVGIDSSNGQFLVRMDADDFSMPNRIEKQLEFMQSNRMIDILGSGVRFIGSRHGKFKRIPTKSEEIRATLLFHNPFFHPSVMIRANLMNDKGLRYDTGHKSEDYNLWARASQIEGIGFANIKKPLICYRIHEQQITKTTHNSLAESGKRIRRFLLENILEGFSDEEMALYDDFATARRPITNKEFRSIESFLSRIQYANKKKHIYDEKALKTVLFRKLNKEYVRHLLRLRLSGTRILSPKAR